MEQQVQTDVQQEDSELLAIKQYIRKYGKLTIVVVLLFAIIGVGATYWYRKSAVIAKNASQIFQEMVLAELHQDSQTASAKGGQLISDYSNTPYAQFASLLLAKISVGAGDLDKAVEQLRLVADKKGSKNLARHLAVVRLAAVYLEQNKLDAALDLVKKDPDPAYVALYAQARGDVYVAKGDIEEAKKAYMLAMQSMPAGVQSPLLQMKVLDLGGMENV